eukprot:s1941_g6.t1
MDFSSLDRGDPITIVAELICFDPAHDSHLLKDTFSRVKVYFTGLLEAGFESYTICDAVMDGQFPVPRIVSGETTKVLSHSKPTWRDFRKLIDACSGFGGVSHGALAVGMQTTVAVDTNDKMLGLHEKHSGSELVVGDIGLNSTIFDTWRKADNAAVMSAGFNCQPFSRLGDQKGGDDPRSSSLLGVLRAAILLRIRVVCLECVKPARNDPFVVKAIGDFLRLTGFVKEVVDLKLEDVWPCRRGRCWWILSHPEIGPMHLAEWPPLHNLAKVGNLIPYICKWDPRDELALSLDPVESAAFGVDDDQYAHYLLQPNAVAPCALHAWGSQLKACPCGCRSAALSPQRLADKGLFGLLVQSASEHLPAPSIRHVHPNEALALNGMDCSLDFGENVRLSLSAVGQIASPLQAAWVLGSVMAKIDVLRYGSCEFQPLAHLHAFRSWLVMRCQMIWPCNDPVISDPKLQQLVDFWKPHCKLFLQQLVDQVRWADVCDKDISLAAVLDGLIRSAPVPCLAPVPLEDGEIPVFDSVRIDPAGEACMSCDRCVVTFVSPDDPGFDVSFTCGATLRDLFQAHAALVGDLHVVRVCDASQRELSFDHVLEVGQHVHVTLGKGIAQFVRPSSALASEPVQSGNDEGTVHWPEVPCDMPNSGECGLLPIMPGDGVHVLCSDDVDTFPGPGECGLLPKMPEPALIAATALDGTCPDMTDVVDAFPAVVSCEPTATWTQPCCAPNAPDRSFDVGICSVVNAPSDQPWSSVMPLLGLEGDQFLSLHAPSIEDPSKLWAVRHQFVRADDRLQLLAKQHDLWADDEIRFHLHAIQQAYVHACVQRGDGITELLVIDPLLAAAWNSNQAFPCEQWARAHPEVLRDGVQVIGVFRVDRHWIPVRFAPVGQHVNILTWDSPSNSHDELNNLLERLAHAWGFQTFLVQRQQRLFFSSHHCGALAVHFVHHVLFGTLLPTSGAEAQASHAMLRQKFADAMLSCQVTMRPWVWARGDSESSEHEWPSADPSPAHVSQEVCDRPEVQSAHVCLSRDERIDLIQQHGLAMADDEMRFHLTTLVDRRALRRLVEPHLPEVVYFEFLNFLNWHETGHILTDRWCTTCPQVLSHGCQIASLLHVDDHWMPLWFVPHDRTLTIHTFDDEVDCAAIDGKLRWMGQRLGFADTVIHRFSHGLPSHRMCGAHALAFLAHALLDAPLPSSLADVDTMRVAMRGAFVAELYENRICRCPTIWGEGGSGALVKSLAEELAKHGVPTSLAETRASQAIKAIGSEQLLHALEQKQPWRSLKALANNVNFKFVLPAELAATVEANKGKPVGRKGARDRAPPGLPAPLDLDPSKLQVLDGTFRANGQVLQQLSPQQIGPLSTGFILMTPHDAEPYLKSGQLVSKEPLALIVFHRKDVVLQSMLSQTQCTVPCRCMLDNEPVLAEASIVQIGSGVVEKSVGTNPVAMDSPEVCTIKISVYKDEHGEAWGEFCKSPIRSIVSMLPELRRCMSTGCDCAAWHNTENLAIADPILDLWKRQFLKFGFKQSDPPSADFFNVSVRIPACLLQRVLMRSGVNGLYLEPRTADGQSVLDSYMVIWVSKQSLQQLQHAKQLNPAVSGLARVGDRRGLRVPVEHALDVHNAIKPGSLFLPQGTRAQYLVGPLPFGLDRQAVSKVLRQAGWQCKPLQPAAPQPGRGAMWLIQAVDSPPNSIVHTTHGEVLITKHKANEAPQKGGFAPPVASPSTLALCGGPGPSKEDPWTNQDPWGHYKPVSAVCPVPDATVSMHQLESKIQSAVLARLPQAMEQDDVPERLSTLEGQVHQLLQKQTQIEGKFGDFSAQQTQQVASLQNQINTQAQTMHGQIEQQNQSIQAMFETQLAHIRGLLAKRPRAWKGVGILSKTPVRKLPNDWPKEVVESARALAFTSLVDDVWISGGVVYGEPESQLYPERLKHTEALLQSVIQTVCFLQTGPRFVSGDWNVDQNSLPSFDLLSRAGFRDLQDVAAERWAIVPKPTCKARTRKDFCFISPELQALLQHVSVLDDIWPDHAVLQGHFYRLKQAVPRDIWTSPSQFPWPSSFDVEPDLWTHLSGNPTDRYAALWKQFEQSACDALPYQVNKRMCGRGQTLRLKSVPVGRCPPARVARRGDFNPHFHGSSFRHTQWVRQVRRVQAFSRHVKSNASTSPCAVSVWASVIRAKGFPGGFTAWWSQLDCKVYGAPAHLPFVPPCYDVAIKVFETLVVEVRAFELQLKSTSRQYARLRRAQNPNQIFRDIRDSPANGVDFLLRPLTASVLEVRSDENALVVDPPHQWHIERPLFCNGVPVSLIHAEPDCLCVSSVEDCQPGCLVSQLHAIGNKDELAAEFIAAWKSKWDRHRDVSADRWQTILAFAREHLVQVPMTLPSMDVSQLLVHIAHKKPQSAGGLDGVTVHDLQCLPSAAVRNFCHIFAEAERTGEWPLQLLNGRVVCLAKTSAPQGVMDYRPITILGHVYRLWGSHFARLGIRALEQVLPDTLYGSRPCRFAGQVWSQLLWAVEDSITQGVDLTGIFADIQKAFNCIPRLVVFEAAALLGFPMSLLTAWAGALSQLGRRFQLGPNLTSAVYSVTGMPEGDGLSCLGMVIVDILFHEWHRQFFPLCQPVSYVDDWTLLTTCPARMHQMFACLQSFTEALDLHLDMKKTCTWSVTAAGRRSLQSQGFVVVTQCRSLGAHIQTTRQHTNSTQMDRVNSLQGLWLKLRLSTCSYSLKVRALRTAAWPRGLHAIPATTVALATFKSLRSGAMKGLGADGAGCSPFVHLGLVEQPSTDPHFWTIAQTFRMIRDCGIEGVVTQALRELVQGSDRIASNGISATLLTRIQCLGWHIQDECVRDTFGRFSLFQISLDELHWRMEYAWLKVVAAQVAHRPGFAELARCDPARTRQWLATLSPCDGAAARKILNGAHITQDGKHYCQEVESDVCEFCESADSRFHRFWQCPVFEAARVDVDEDLWKALPHLPESMVSYGWALRPSTFEEWYGALAQVCVPPLPARPVVPGSCLHVFTDGSCSNPQYPDARFAGWAVVSADPHHELPAQILDCGCLPGLRQTSIRAELFAVHRAIRLAVVHGLEIHIWCDCLAVVKRLLKLLQGGRVRINTPNADLWTVLHDDLQISQQRISITKVAAHRSVAAAASPLEEWCFMHNHYSDRVACRANQCRTAAFWDLAQRHFHACLLMDRWNMQVRTVLMNISHLVLQRETPQEVELEPAPAPVVPPWIALRPLLSLPEGALRWYPADIVRPIVSWFWQTVYESCEQVVWVSHAQLFLDFVFSTGEVGPMNLSGWKNGSHIPLHALRSYSFKQRVRWFAKVLKEILRHAGCDVKAGYHRPASEMIAMFSGCLAVPWPAQRLEHIDRWLLRFTTAPFRRQSKAMDSLPVPARDDLFPEVFLTSCS